MTTLTAGYKHLLNHNMGAIAGKVRLGDQIEAAGQTTLPASVFSALLAPRGCTEYFNTPIIQAAAAGGAPTGSTGDVNYFMTRNNVFEWKVLGAGQTIVNFVYVEGSGVNIAQDQAADEGCEITQGITSSSLSKFVAGTDRFYFQARLKLADVSGTDDLCVGLRKAEAYQAAVDNYDEAAFFNVNGGDVTIETILNNGTTATTDSTVNVADNQYVDLRIEVDHVAGLASALLLANAIKAQFNSHCRDAEAHTTAVDSTNLVTTADATTLATLITLTNALTTAYDAHEGDSELASDWVYHAAQEAGNVSLAATTAVTDLPTAIKRLNDLRTKYNSHDADDTAHGVASANQVATAAASSTIFKVGVNGAAIAVPATTAPFTFDNGEVVVPFIYFLHHTDLMDTLYLQRWECGLLA